MASTPLRKAILAIAITKIIVLTTWVGVYSEWIELGERALSGASEPAKPQEEKPKANILGKKKEKPKEPTEEVDIEELAENSAPSEGFLSDLLTPPDLSKAPETKEEIAGHFEILTRLQQQIEGRMTALKEQATRLESVEQSIEGKLERIDEERQNIASMIQKEKDLQGTRLEALVEIYKKMDPKKAAPIFAEMDRDLVVAIFQKIDNKQITKILELMDPQKSNEISAYYGRVGSMKELEILRELNKSIAEVFKDECATPTPPPPAPPPATEPN